MLFTPRAVLAIIRKFRNNKQIKRLNSRKMSKEKAIAYINRAKEQLSGDSLTVRFCQMACDNLDKALKELKETTMLTSDG